jgi:penicillin-binding protein 1A
MSPRTSTRIVLSLVLVLGLVVTACAQLEDLPVLTDKDLKFKPPESSKLYDRSGNLITTFHGVQNRTVVPLDRIPEVAQKAVLAIEDERFYEHEGVDVRAIARAMVANVRSGGIEEGGSTLTQQLVKQTIIAPGDIADQTLKRKIDEAALARQLEKRLTKDEILFRYLNTVYFGAGAYGIQAASKAYFGRGVHRLKLRHAALLAGIIKSPQTYGPFRNRKRAKARRNVVLEKLKDLGWVEAEPADRVAQKPLGLQKQEDTTRYAAPYFVDYVQRLIKWDSRFSAVGKTAAQREKRLFTGGLRIHTTVDLNMQAAGEEAVRSVLPYPNDPHAALVALDPQTGHVRAMVGGRNYFAKKRKDRFAKLNLAIVAEPGLGPKARDPVLGTKIKRAPGTGRQAGSAFKPFALAAALASGKSLSETYKASGSMEFPGADSGKPWRVQNYEGSEFGTVTLLEATIKSINVVYAQLILDVGSEKVVETATAMGIRTPLLAVPSAVLGANPVNALGMASAYGTFATYGLHHPPVAIKKILDRDGKVIYQDKTKPVQAIDPGVAYLATSAMKGVITGGTGTAAAGYLGGRPAAGKTGTAQEYRDAWFGGYTPNLAAAVWVGYPEGSIEMKTSCYTGSCRPTRIQVTGGSWPTQIWGAFMQRALAELPAPDFEVPSNSNLVTVTIDTRTGCLASGSTPDLYRRSAYYVSGTEPKSSCAAPTATVPPVVGMSAGEAQSTLQSHGFNVEVVTKRGKGGRAGSGAVWRQSPSGGSEAAQGTTVTVWVNP